MAAISLSLSPTDARADALSAAPARLRPRFPRLLEYLASLPGGLQAYPECQARSGILHTFLEAAPAMPDDLDPWVARLLRPPPRGFMSEVALSAAFLAIADAAGMSEAQYCAWSHAANARLFDGLIYRALMSLFSPMVLLERAPSRWEAFHTGTRLSVKQDGPACGVGELSFPERLFTPLLLRGFAESFAAAFENARGRDVTVELGAHAPTSAVFVARWR